MMRNIFILFFGVNILVFLLYFYLPEKKQNIAPMLPANVTKLVLLSEVDKASLIVVPEPTVAVDKVVTENVVKVEIERCFTIGPFKERGRTESVLKSLAAKITKTTIRERKENFLWGYWVYLPDPGGRKKAVALAADLARKGLTDYYVIARGDQKDSISLGHFKDKQLAEKRFESIKAMKFTPKIEPIEKEYSLFWLDYAAMEGLEISSKELEIYEPDEAIRQFSRECKK
jgi:hypothetical protein